MLALVVKPQDQAQFNMVKDFLEKESIEFVSVEEKDDDNRLIEGESTPASSAHADALHTDEEDSTEENVDIEKISDAISKFLNKYSISQTFFADSVLSKKQTTFSELLKHKKTPKSPLGWRPWLRMRDFLASEEEKSDLITSFRQRNIESIRFLFSFVRISL